MGTYVIEGVELNNKVKMVLGDRQQPPRSQTSRPIMERLREYRASSAQRNLALNSNFNAMRRSVRLFHWEFYHSRPYLGYLSLLISSQAGWGCRKRLNHLTLQKGSEHQVRYFARTSDSSSQSARAYWVHSIWLITATHSPVEHQKWFPSNLAVPHKQKF